MNTHDGSIELFFDAYQQRQWHEVSARGLAARAQKLAPAGKFRREGNAWVPTPYQGHAVLAVLNSTRDNDEAVRILSDTQEALVAGFNRVEKLFPLPPASFHQTIANTLSDENYHREVVQKGLADVYPARVATVLSDIKSGSGEVPVMRMVGISLFGTALGVLGVFHEKSAFDRVLALRDEFYTHLDIAALGIRRTRPFIGHITLGYIESVLDEAERFRLVEVVSDLNRALAEQNVLFSMPLAELRAYDHLAEFRPLPHLPNHRF